MKLLISVCLAGVLAVGAAAAETTQESGGQLAMPAQTKSASSMPYRGLDMSGVARSWGEPREKVAAVGQPPISRWIYDGFTVYFEHQDVIHSVRHRSADASQS